MSLWTGRPRGYVHTFFKTRAMTQKKRKRKELNNATWPAKGLAIRKVQTALLTDDEKKRLITLTDEERKCVAFFFFCLFQADAHARAFDPFPRVCSTN